MIATPIGPLQGLGPVTRGWLEDAGIGTVDDLRNLGSVEVFRRLKFMMPKKVSLNALYGLEAAIRGCHWLDLPPEVKESLREQAKAIDAALRKSMAARRAIE